LEPSNAPDAAHRSPRSISPKRNEGWVPRWTRTRESIKQNKELAGYSGVLFHRSRNLARRLPFGISRLASDHIGDNLGDLSANAMADRRLISEIRTNNTK